MWLRRLHMLDPLQYDPIYRLGLRCYIPHLYGGWKGNELDVNWGGGGGGGMFKINVCIIIILIFNLTT